MSEGGVCPWKRNSNHKAVAAPEYKCSLRPLPDPLAGLSWIHDETAPEKWILFAHTIVQVHPHPTEEQQYDDDESRLVVVDD